MTVRQRQVLQLVHDAIQATGVSPSLMELGKRMGTTHGAVCRLVQGLEREGYLRRAGGMHAHRSLEVLRMPRAELLAAEIAWCHANPERVRAMIKLVSPAWRTPSPARNAAASDASRLLMAASTHAAGAPGRRRGNGSYATLKACSKGAKRR